MMIIPEYKLIAKTVPDIHCCECGMSSHDHPVYSPKFMGLSNEDKPTPNPGKEYCLGCWEKVFDQQPRVTKLTVTINPDGSRSSKQERIVTFDERQRETEDGFVIEGHPWPHAPGSILPPQLSTQQLSVNLVDLAIDFLHRGGMASSWMLDSDMNHHRTMKVFKSLPPDVRKSVQILISGKVPQVGLALGGNSNIGKTGAIASWIVAWAINHIRRFGPLRGLGGVEASRARYRNEVFAWLNWLHDYSEWRKACDEPSRMKALTQLWEPLVKIPLLVIDDLGAETPMPVYGANVVEDALARLIDSRSEGNRPTLVTTNLDEDSLRSYLGERTANRLLDNNPFVALPGDWAKLSRRRG